jgi:hypothetical protein
MKSHEWIRRCVTAAASLLAGGTVLGTCEARLHDSAVNGTKIWFLSLFDPANFTDLGLFPTTDDPTTP